MTTANGGNFNANNKTFYGNGNTITGNNNIIYGDGNVIRGNNNIIYGDGNEIRGNNNIVYGNGNAIRGNNNQCRGNNNNCRGNNNNNNGNESIVNTVIGDTHSHVFINGTEVPLGQFNHINSISSTIGGDVMINGVVLDSTPAVPRRNFIRAENNHVYIENNAIVSSREVMQPEPKTPKKPARIPDEPSAADGEVECKICFDHSIKCIIRPCNHFICNTCCWNLKKDECPFCKGAFTGVETVYM